MSDHCKIDESLVGEKPFTYDEAEIKIPLNEDWKTRQNERHEAEQRAKQKP